MNGAATPTAKANGNGHQSTTISDAIAAAVLVPRLTDQGLQKLLARESHACGPGLLTVRMRAVADAQRQDEAKLLAGALEDLAAAAVGWSYRIRQEHGIWPKTPATG